MKGCAALASIQTMALRMQSPVGTPLGPQTQLAGAAARRALLPQAPPDTGGSRTRKGGVGVSRRASQQPSGRGRGRSWGQPGLHILLSAEPAIQPRGWALGQEDGGQARMHVPARGNKEQDRQALTEISAVVPVPLPAERGRSLGLVSLALWLGATVGSWRERQGIWVLPSQRWEPGEKG